MKKVLVIAGLDPTGGAGILLDVAIFKKNNLFPYAAVSALTVQNSLGVKEYINTDKIFLQNEIDVLMDEGSVSALKIGMIGSIDNTKEIVKAINKYSFEIIVLDAIIKASDNTYLNEEKSIEYIKKELFPLCTVVTFNRFEAEIYSNMKLKDEEDIFEAIIELRRYCKETVIKGGHFEGENVLDFYDTGREVIKKSKKRLKKRVRGTGCAFSSTLLCKIIQLKDREKAFIETKKEVLEMIQKAKKIGRGSSQIII